jgi:pre-mRNA-splicing factor 38A
MANRTVKDAKTVKGTNPQYLVEKIIRTRIYESKYWKEECFALSAELLVDKAMELKYIGGSFGGNVKPTPFLCLILKMLQIQPEKDIVVEFITQQDFKYVRALGAMYMRLVGTSIDCYKYLEPLYYDYRKLKRMNKQGLLELIHMDELIDELLTEERIFDTILPRIQKRFVLEDENQLEPRVSALEEDGVEDMESDDEEGEFKDGKDVALPGESKGGYRDWDKPHRSPSPRYRRSRSKSPHRRRGGSRERDSRKDRDRERDRERDKGRDKDRDKEKEKRRRRSHSREKDRTRSRRDDKDADGHHHHHRSKRTRKDKDDTDHSKDTYSKESQSSDIREANELRSKLGMAPLRP